MRYVGTGVLDITAILKNGMTQVMFSSTDFKKRSTTCKFVFSYPDPTRFKFVFSHPNPLHSIYRYVIATVSFNFPNKTSGHIFKGRRQ